MIFREIFIMAIGSLGVNKLRSWLTILGVTIGIFSVIGVMTTVTAIRSSIESGLNVLGSNTFQFVPPKNDVSGGGKAAKKVRGRRPISYPEARRFIQLMEDVTEVIAPRLSAGNVQATYPKQKPLSGLQIFGTNQYFVTTNQFIISYGRNITPEDVEAGKRVAVIGHSIEEEIFRNESPIGKTIKFDGQPYQIVGVFASKGNFFSNNQDNTIVVPITAFLEKYGSRGRYVGIAVQAPSQETLEEVIDRATQVMRRVRGLSAGEENDFDIFQNDRLISAFDKVGNVVATGAFIISAIALLAAGVGIMNIMLVSVTERTKEIGIRKSVGAKKNTILVQFLFEAILLCLVGGALGIVLGVLGGNSAATFWFKVPIIFPWAWATFSVVICTAIGLTFGLYPAYRAAALNPIEALSFE